MSVQRYINPGWSYARALGISENEKSLDKAVAALNGFSQSVITQRRHEYEQKGLNEKHDILSLFLSYEKKEAASPAEKGRITDTFLRDVVLNMIIAGRDTTACTLTWAFYVLGTNPDLQERLVQEIADALTGEKPNYDNTKAENLPLVNGFLMEVLRLWPPVSADPKVQTAPSTCTDALLLNLLMMVSFDARAHAHPRFSPRSLSLSLPPPPPHLKGCLEDDTLPDGTFVPKGCEVPPLLLLLLLLLFFVRRSPLFISCVRSITYPLFLPACLPLLVSSCLPCTPAFLLSGVSQGTIQSIRDGEAGDILARAREGHAGTVVQRLRLGRDQARPLDQVEQSFSIWKDDVGRQAVGPPVLLSRVPGRPAGVLGRKVCLL
jgi:hypothetical protein